MEKDCKIGLLQHGVAKTWVQQYGAWIDHHAKLLSWWQEVRLGASQSVPSRPEKPSQAETHQQTPVMGRAPECLNPILETPITLENKQFFLRHKTFWVLIRNKQSLKIRRFEF